MTRSYKTEGIIIKRKNVGEADRILTVLTKHYGKIQIKAKGVRKISSRRSAHIELLNHSLLTLYKSFNMSFPIVTEAQTLENFTSIKSSLRKIGYAYYICELINGLCADNQENRGVFFNLKSTLAALSQTSNAHALVQNFEKELLSALGFWSEVKLLQTQDSKTVMEKLLERKLKTLRVIPLFIS